MTDPRLNVLKLLALNYLSPHYVQDIAEELNVLESDVLEMQRRDPEHLRKRLWARYYETLSKG